MNYQVNLLPVELQPRPPIGPKKIALAVILVLLFGCLGFAYGYFSIQLSTVKGEISFLSQEQDRLKKTEARIKELHQEQQAMQEQIKTLSKLLDDRKTWPKMLLSINQSVPDSVWISKLALTGSPAPTANSTEGKKETTTQNQGNSQQAAKPSAKEVVNQLTSVGVNQANQPKSGNSSNNGESQDKPKVPETAPNFVVIEGGSYSLEGIGKFVYSLNRLVYLASVELAEITQDETGKYNFIIKAPLKEGVND